MMDMGTSLRLLETGTPWANRAELYIGLVKEAVRKDMKECECPMRLSDYCIERRAQVNNITAKDAFKLKGTNAHSATLGDTGDISNIYQLKWYEWVYSTDEISSFPSSKEELGRSLGPAKGEGNEMAQWVLVSTGKVVPRRTVRPLRVAEIHNVCEEKRREIFDEIIMKKLGSSYLKGSNSKSKAEEPGGFTAYVDEDEVARIFQRWKMRLIQQES